VLPVVIVGPPSYRQLECWALSLFIMGRVLDFAFVDLTDILASVIGVGPYIIFGEYTLTPVLARGTLSIPYIVDCATDFASLRHDVLARPAGIRHRCLSYLEVARKNQNVRSEKGLFLVLDAIPEGGLRRSSCRFIYPQERRRFEHCIVECSKSDAPARGSHHRRAVSARPSLYVVLWCTKIVTLPARGSVATPKSGVGYNIGTYHGRVTNCHDFTAGTKLLK
jgi:hypothetical protein